MVLALFLVLMGTDACRSDVKIISASDKGVIARIELTGQITKAEIGKFEKVVALLRPIFDIVQVDLDSPGGDVLAAMQMGEIIRTNWLHTVVSDEPPAKGCMSACVLILAAGAVRMMGDNPKVGIHRPYFDQGLFAGLDQAQAKANTTHSPNQLPLIWRRWGCLSACTKR
jgi:membrane-bound ClpP family serine protease